jgi:hemerythrin-like domain-containing protein
LFRRFGEDYHERRLEEPFIFPAVKQLNPELARYVEILLTQHQRGREITDYIMSQTSGQKLATDASALSAALDSFVLMYQEHTAREDTIIFPAWHKLLSPHAYEEMGDKFEGIERQQFGHDGFEDAVKQIGAIEADLGLADLAQFTAPPPPKP